MKGRILRMITALLLLMFIVMSLSACIEKSKWRVKDQGGAPNWMDERIDYGA